jgi:transcriptional regulator with XRE-family HTH domain
MQGTSLKLQRACVKMKPTTKDPGFPDRLKRMLRERKQSQSDMARDMFGMETEYRKATDSYHEVPKGRQLFSKWLAGKAYPSDEMKVKLADAFHVKYQEMFPNEDPLDRPGSGITFQQINKKDAFLELHMELPIDKAMEVIRIVREYAK